MWYKIGCKARKIYEAGCDWINAGALEKLHTNSGEDNLLKCLMLSVYRAKR